MITIRSETRQYFFNDQKGMIQSHGKFNRVFKGYDASYRPVLIKQLLPALSIDADAVKRFSNEFSFRTEHPNIIPAIDYFVHDKQHYLVRQWVDGTDLSSKVHQLKPKEAVRACMAVLQALNHLHGNNILHSDVQPKNIIIGEDGQVYLTDLGLAIKPGQDKQRQPFNIYYSAPEQVLNRQELVNGSTDLFAVGMLLFELLNRSKPHQHQNPEILMNLMLAAPLVNNNRMNARLFSIIQKATGKPRFNLPPTHYTGEELSTLIKTAQANRYQNAGAFINDLLALSEADLKPKPFYQFW
ncbi:MAG: serine/threonine-protein kinase [Bacteroidota bacterium]